jgi:hypothetical protein
MSMMVLVIGGGMMAAGLVGMAIASRHIREEQGNRRGHRMIRRLAANGALVRWG